MMKAGRLVFTRVRLRKLQITGLGLPPKLQPIKPSPPEPVEKPRQTYLSLRRTAPRIQFDGATPSQGLQQLPAPAGEQQSAAMAGRCPSP